MKTSLITFGFESKGRLVASGKIPWFAKMLWVELSVRVPPNYQHNQEDFVLDLDSGSRILGGFFPVQSEKGGLRAKVRFEFSSDMVAFSGDAVFKGRHFTKIDIPWVSRSQFLEGLKLISANLVGMHDGNLLGCSSFCGFGKNSLMANFLLHSDHGFEFISEINMRVEYSLSGRKMYWNFQPGTLDDLGSSLPISVPLTGLTRQTGNLDVLLLVDGQEIGNKIFKGLTQAAFQKLLSVPEKTFVVWKKDGTTLTVENLEEIMGEDRFTPVFFVRTTVLGLAGITDLKILAYSHGSHEPLVLWSEKIAVCDSPISIAPVNLSGKDAKGINFFELIAGKTVVGTIRTGSQSSGIFTPEGTIANVLAVDRTENISVQDIFKKLKQFSAN